MVQSRLFLIDAHALCYRSFYAIKGLTTSKGQATNAVFGFVNALKKILNDYHPEYLAVCFDSPGKTHRSQQFSEYKIQRPAMPDDLVSQISIIKEVVKEFGVALFEASGYEADDIIATLVHKIKGKDIEAVIVSDDKDMYQLMNSHVKVLSLKQEKILNEADIKVKLGFSAQRIIDFIALAGDSTDNIPGVPGVGEVTARNLINEFNSVDEIYKRLDAVKQEKVREKLLAGKDSAKLSKELAILESNVPIKVNIDELKVTSPNRSRLFEIFRELEFRRLSEEFAEENTLSDAQSEVEVLNIDNTAELKKVLSVVKQFAKCFFVINQEDEGVFLTVDSQNVFFVSKNLINELKEIFEDENILKVTDDLKRAFKVLNLKGIDLKGRLFDVTLAAYLLGLAQGSYKIADLIWVYLKKSLPEGNALAETTCAIYQLFSIMDQELTDKQLGQLFNDIEIPLTRVLSKMEQEGVKLDLDLMSDLSKQCDQKIQLLTKQLYVMAKEEFNLNSPKQLSVILFEKLKMPVIKKTKTGFSTDEDVLTTLAQRFEFPVLLLEYRQLSKLKSTYIDALPAMVNPGTGRIHAEFDQTGAETGRLSSKRPNLQNIPIRTELGREIRKAFIPSDKQHVIIAADYSQIELRILAHLSQDENLIRAFLQDQDIHQYTASLVFEVNEKKVTSQMRDTAKRVNFGIVYGLSAFGLSKDLKISQTEAQDFIDRYFLRYPGVRTFLDQEVKKCEKEGYVVTLLNRRRYIPEINSKNMSMRQFAQRQAINTPVQGSAADLMKLAMVNVQKELENKKMLSKMIITVHDELVCDVLEKEKDAMVKLLRDVMEHPLKLSVPIKVSVKIGKNWLETK